MQTNRGSLANLVFSQGAHTSGKSGCLFEIQRDVWKNIVKSLTTVKLYRGMSKLKIEINVNLFQLLCIDVSVALNGEFERFGRFCVDCYYTLQDGDKDGKLIFDRSSAKPIFTQKLESPGFQIEHQMNWKVDASSRGVQSKIHSKSKR